MEDQTSVEFIDYKKQLGASILKKLSDVSASPGGSCCIYIVHEKFRRTNAYSYTPEMVAIGPFHHDKVTLQDMEDHKLWYMNALLTRTGDKEAKLQECVEAISSRENEIRKCYSKQVEPDRNKFVEMMIVDGLFIIELFCKSVGEEIINGADPIFDNLWAMSSLVRDMILLENQLPMLVLDRLFRITMGKKGCKSLAELTIYFFNPLMPRKKKFLENYLDLENKNTTSDHLLDLLGKSFHDLHRDVQPNNGLKEDGDPQLKTVPCTIELRQAGVKFRKGNNSGNFLDIRFIDGVLEIPPILVQDQTDTLLRNLIALEQCSNGRDTCMTSYALLMSSLIGSADDVAFLCKVGIITNYLADDKCVCSLFHKLCSEVTLVDFHYSDLCYQLNAFYARRWNAWFAAVRRGYLLNPWKVVSLAAVILLLIFTIISTVFSVLSFAYRP